MARIKFLFFFFLLGGVVSAQEQVIPEIRFSGVVLDQETTLPIANVNCRRGEYVSTTDLQGRFAMNTQIGDTILFTHIGFKPYEVIVPDTLTTGEYILAVFMSSDTLTLPEVVVVHRYGERYRQYKRNARNNMAGIMKDAYSPSLEMTPQQNQKRILDEYAASTNKGHVDVKLGIGLESYRVLQKMLKEQKVRREPELLYGEEIDLIKMLYNLNRREREQKKQ